MDSTRPAVNGFLLLSKARGLTSMDAVRRVKRVTGLRKGVGHGGTLDPLAEGILVICLGQATRLMEFLINETKEYRMEVRLGVSTDTYDAEGVITSEKDPTHLTRQLVEEALGKFRGILSQMPPMHSALKKGGKRLYELARQGLEVEREPREGEVSRLTLVDYNLPYVTLEADCGRGVYMRSLAHDLGEELGCGAHVFSLERTRIGPFHVDKSLSLEELVEAGEEGKWRDLVWAPDSLLLHLKSAVVDEAAEKCVRNGQPISLGHRSLYARHLEGYRLYSRSHQFFAVVRFNRPNNRWDPHKVFRIEEPSPYATQETPGDGRRRREPKSDPT